MAPKISFSGIIGMDLGTVAQSGGHSTGHKIRRFGYDDYTIRWQVDYYCAGNRGGAEAGYWSCWTNRAGAERFAKKWGISMPDTTPEGKG